MTTWTGSISLCGPGSRYLLPHRSPGLSCPSLFFFVFLLFCVLFPLFFFLLFLLFFFPLFPLFCFLLFLLFVSLIFLLVCFLHVVPFPSSFPSFPSSSVSSSSCSSSGSSSSSVFCAFAVLLLVLKGPDRYPLPKHFSHKPIWPIVCMIGTQQHQAVFCCCRTGLVSFEPDMCLQTS